MADMLCWFQAPLSDGNVVSVWFTREPTAKDLERLQRFLGIAQEWLTAELATQSPKEKETP